MCDSTGRRTDHRQQRSVRLSISNVLNGLNVLSSSVGGRISRGSRVLAAKLPSTLEILHPSAAQDKDSVTVTAATAARYHLTSIASLKPYAKDLVIGGPPEFRTRPYGLTGLKKNYGLTFKALRR
jgi:osmoprotectant transport system substrate-binding protein